MFSLSEDQKSRILDRILEEYVEEHGLGGMAKSDFDALLLWLLVREQPGTDLFNLSSQFRIREARIKSLLETAAVKFDQTTEQEAWQSILSILSKVDYDIESLEKGQVRFQLRDPMLFRWVQRGVRQLESTCSYNRSSEQVTMNLDVLYLLLDRAWEERGFGDNWKGKVLTQAHKDIQIAVGRIGKKIAGNELEDLRSRKLPKLRGALEKAVTLANIGTFLVPLVEKLRA
jgi:hypothetical protein